MIVIIRGLGGMKNIADELKPIVTIIMQTGDCHWK